jgi:peptidyl-prolyl cis-trans isomerase A (cyclophilin A)
MVAASALAIQVAAQTPTGQSVGGRVLYASGQALADVGVSLAGPALRTPRTAKTGPDGAYEFTAVPDGVYAVSFQSTGFKKAVRANVVVQSGVDVRLDMVMTLAAISPEVGPTPLVAAKATFSRQSDANTAPVLVRVQTKLGEFDIAVDVKRAPVTSANFLKYVDAGLYDGGRFHRATRPDNYKPALPNRPPMELIQGGINPEKKGQGFPPIPLERTSITGLKHVRGVVSMARGGPDTATSDFFILLDDQPSLDFGGKRFDDNQGAAAFGVVISGLDVVMRIQQQPVEGQNLSPAVPIVSVRRIPK